MIKVLLYVSAWIVATLSLLTFSGCAITGTKSVDMWGLKWENFAGMDVNAGYSNVDEVNNQRGIKQPVRTAK